MNFIMPEGKPLFTVGGWPVFVRKGGLMGWTHIRLIKQPLPEKRWDKKGWWLAWNGERLARTRDSEHLRTNNSAVHDVLIKALKDHLPADPLS